MWEWITELPMIIIVVVIVVVACGVGALLWYGVFARPIEDAKREVIKGSHAYVEGNRTRILKLVTEYNDLGTKVLTWKAAEGSNTQVIQQFETQQEAVKKQLQEAVERMDPDQVPEGAKTILNKETGKNDKDKSSTFVYFGTVDVVLHFG